MSEQPPGEFELPDGWSEYYDLGGIILDPRDPDVLEHLQQSGGHVRPVDYFGGAYIAHHNRLKTHGKLWSETSAMFTTHAAELPDIMASIRDDLMAIADNDEVRPLFEARAPLIPAELHDNIYQSGKSSLSEALQVADDDTLTAFIEWNKAYIDSVGRNMLPQIENTLKLFRERMTYAIRHQNLPVSMEQLETRMSHLTVTVVDPVSMLLHNAEGHYRPNNLQTSVPATDDLDYLTRVMTHELLHHISGKTILDRGVTRSDLAFDINTAAPDWMIEACTEQLAILLLSRRGAYLDFSRITSRTYFTEGQHAYPSYRKVMQTLSNGDPQLTQLLLAAYFEDARPHNQGHLPHTEAFWQTIATSLGFSTPESGLADLRQFGDRPTTPQLAALHRRIRFNQAVAQSRRNRT